VGERGIPARTLTHCRDLACGASRLEVGVSTQGDATDNDGMESRSPDPARDANISRGAAVR
jgi:hypothetical protein